MQHKERGFLYAILLPPVYVYKEEGCSSSFCMSIGLTALMIVPGSVYAATRWKRKKDRLGRDRELFFTPALERRVALPPFLLDQDETETGRGTFRKNRREPLAESDIEPQSYTPPEDKKETPPFAV
ncbi:MAG: uncharacterized protein A8A55_1588 [Amphiamblys sp. WSBS2006]|nr:MAG: uncharacterized protein A8A55_1588 [Amphiamblys sp. WSBS2006]